MPAVRDPLSVRYDRTVFRILRGAVEAHSRRRGVATFVASPPAEFRALDKGGRTAHERAFTRAAYYRVVKVPEHLGQPQWWSLRLTWGPIERRGSRWGRTVQVRLYRYRRAAYAVRRAPRAWITDPAARSSVVNRVDQAAG